MMAKVLEPEAAKNAWICQDLTPALSPLSTPSLAFLPSFAHDHEHAKGLQNP